jgi:hypothetical protein
MTDIQFLTRVTGWRVNVSDANPLLGLRTFTAWERSMASRSASKSRSADATDSRTSATPSPKS